MIKKVISKVVGGVNKVLTPDDIEVSDAILAEVSRQDLCHDGLAVLDFDGIMQLLRVDYAFNRDEVIDGIEQLKFEHRIQEVLEVVDNHSFVVYRVSCGDVL